MTRRILPLLALATLVAVPDRAAAQDTTRVKPDSTRAAPRDTTRPDSTQQPRQAPAPRVDVPRVPPPVQPPWRFVLDLGLQDVAGNRDLTVFNGAFTVERRRQDRFLLSSKVEGRYGESNGSTSVNTQSLKTRFDWAPRDPISPFVGLDFVRDPIRKLALRTQVGTGLNFNLVYREENRTLLSVGFVGDFQKYVEGVSPAHAEDTRLYLRGRTTRLFGPVTRFELTAKFEPSTEDFADYLANVDAQLRVGISRRTGILLRYEWWYDSAPVDNTVLRADRALNVSLTISW
jgi:hypothetical protein